MPLTQGVLAIVEAFDNASARDLDILAGLINGATDATQVRDRQGVTAAALTELAVRALALPRTGPLAINRTPAGRPDQALEESINRAIGNGKPAA